MNSFDQAGTSPRVGLIELPDLAELLTRSGVGVVSGATFREAATNAKDASAAASKPLPLIIGDRPTAADGRQAPGINAWAKKMSAQHTVVVIRNHTEKVLTVENATEITLPTTLNTILAALGLPPLATDAAYPATGQAPAAEPVPAPAAQAPVAEDFFTAPAAAAPAPEAAPAPAAPAPAAPAADDFYAAPAPAAPAPAAPAADDFYAAPAPAAPAFEAAPAANDFYAAPAPAQAQAPAFQAPVADDFYAAPAPAAPAFEAAPAANDFYAAPAQAQSPAADDFYAAPASAAPAFEAAPAANDFYAAPAQAQAPAFQAPAADDFYAAPAPAAPAFEAAPAANDFYAPQAPAPSFDAPAAPAFQAPAPVFEAAPAANDFYAPPAPAPAPSFDAAAPAFQAPAQSFDAPAAPAFQAPAPAFEAAPAANDFYAPQAPAPSFPTPAPAFEAAPAANDFYAPQAPAPSFEAPAPAFHAAPAAPAGNDFYAAPAQAQTPAFQTPAPAVQAQAPAFEAAPAAPAVNDFYASPAPAVPDANGPAAGFYGAPAPAQGFNPAAPAPMDEDAFYRNAAPAAPAPAYGAPAAPMVQTAPRGVADSIDRHHSARKRSAGHSATHLANVIICIAGKGGVGKTTTAVSLAQIAAEAGLKVILIDGNVGQADLRTYLRTANSDLPTIYDAAIGRESAIVGPGALNGVRRPEQGKVGFGFVAGPPHDSSVDQYVVTNQDYIKVIHEARQKVDLVILDTQILEARDDSGFVSDVVQPLLLESAFALGITDMTTPGVERLNERLLSLINYGTPTDRIMIMINDVPPNEMRVADNGQRYFDRLGSFVGAVPTNVEEIHDVMNAGSVPSNNRELRTVLTDVLARSTGADVFNAIPEEAAPAPAAKSGLLSRMFKSKKAA